MVVGTLLNEFTTGVGLAAGMIAVGGFLGHVRPALAGAEDDKLREATVRGGLVGIAVAIVVVVLSASVDRLSG